jgi:transposase
LSTYYTTFWDVTNYWFEIGENDPDEVDENGKITQNGLRKRGVSKEHRRDPIVQMGLFIDSNGIPIAYRLFSGNNTDQTTLRPALEKTIDKMDFGKVIVVADGGLNSGTNIGHILNKCNGYIVSKSTKKSDKTVRAWILNEEGYQWNDTHTFKVKSQIRKRKVEFPDGSLKEISEKLVCFWSKNHYERERHENEDFIEYLNSVIANPNKLKDRTKKIEKFLKKTIVNKKTGEPVKNATVTLSIDMAKVKEYLDLMGYYTIMTSEIDKSEQEIIEIYRGLSRIEDSFRITKSNLEGRPVFVRTREHINAHFLTCFIALTMIRLIQYKILKLQGKNANNVNSINNADGWESGLSAEKIQTALCSWQADALPSGYYRTSKPDDYLLLILRAFDIDNRFVLPKETDLRKFKLSIDESVMFSIDESVM